MLLKDDIDVLHRCADDRDLAVEGRNRRPGIAVSFVEAIDSLQGREAVLPSEAAAAAQEKMSIVLHATRGQGAESNCDRDRHYDGVWPPSGQAAVCLARGRRLSRQSELWRGVGRFRDSESLVPLGGTVSALSLRWSLRR